MMIVRAVSGIGKQDGLESPNRVRVPGPDSLKVLQVRGHLSPVPAGEDFLDVLEILVERRSTYAGFLSNASHREAMQAFCGRQRGRPVHDGLGHRVAVGLNGVVPELGHETQTVTRETGCRDDCLDIET